MTKFISKFIPENTVAAAIEFGLLAALITVVSISAVTALGVKLSNQAEIAPPVNSK
jgi:pilus assembly protein Flp/PilA